MTIARAPGPDDRMRYASPAPFVRDRLQVLRDLTTRYGDCCRFRLGFRQVYFLNHPDFVRRLLAVEQRKLRRSAVTQLTRFVLGGSVFNAGGDAHRQQRRRLGPLLHSRRVTAYEQLMVDAAYRHQSRWRHGDRIEVSRVARQLALEIGSRALFGIDLSAEAGVIERSVRILFRTMNRVDHPLHLLGWMLPLPENFRTLRAAWRLRRIAARTCARARENSQSTGTVLRVLLDACERGEISARLVRDEVSLLMVAGHETTAQGLTWALYLIGRHPEVQNRLHAEIDRAFDGGTPDFEALRSAPYIANVIRETLRLFPPSPIFDRYTCSELEVGGWHIPAGTTVFVSPFVTQRDARFFARPEHFDPGRWDGEAGDVHAAYFPFGMGPRRCLGEALATAEMTFVLAVLLRHWTLRAENEGPVEPEALVTLRPKQEIRLRVMRRGVAASLEGGAGRAN